MSIILWDKYNSTDMFKLWDYFRLSESRMNEAFGVPHTERNNLLELTEFVTNNMVIYRQFKPIFETMLKCPPKYHIVVMPSIVREGVFIIQRIEDRIVIAACEYPDGLANKMINKGIFDKFVYVQGGEGIMGGDTMSSRFDELHKDSKDNKDK